MYKLPLFKYPNNWGFQRTPSRPKELWVFDFEKNYDWNNVWYDSIQINYGNILLIGPPLYNTKDYIKNNCKFFDKVGNELAYAFYEMDRVCITVLTTQGFLDELLFYDGTEQHKLPVNLPSAEFKNKKTIVTISKDHPIEWLEQWIDYHVSVHNIEGFVIYNNQSKEYTSQYLQNKLNREDATVVIVDYDVPFGCMGGGDWTWEGKSGNYLPWDSDFSQYIMLEHAKWKYLHNASLAINADTDELLITKNSTLDEIKEYCKNSGATLLYKGVWIEPINSLSSQEAYSVPYTERNFYDYWQTTNSTQRGIGIKWMLNPEKNLSNQWMLHRTTGTNLETNEIYFAHFLAMNTSWSWPRDKFTGNINDLTEHTELRKNLDKWLNCSTRNRK